MLSGVRIFIGIERICALGVRMLLATLLLPWGLVDGRHAWVLMSSIHIYTPEEGWIDRDQHIWYGANDCTIHYESQFCVFIVDQSDVPLNHEMAAVIQ